MPYLKWYLCDIFQSLTKVPVIWWSFGPAQWQFLPVQIFIWRTESFFCRNMNKKTFDLFQSWPLCFYHIQATPPHFPKLIETSVLSLCFIILFLRKHPLLHLKIPFLSRDGSRRIFNWQVPGGCHCYCYIRNSLWCIGAQTCSRDSDWPTKISYPISILDLFLSALTSGSIFRFLSALTSGSSFRPSDSPIKIYLIQWALSTLLWHEKKETSFNAR